MVIMRARHYVHPPPPQNVPGGGRVWPVWARLSAKKCLFSSAQRWVIDRCANYPPLAPDSKAKTRQLTHLIGDISGGPRVFSVCMHKVLSFFRSTGLLSTWISAAGVLKPAPTWFVVAVSWSVQSVSTLCVYSRRLVLHMQQALGSLPIHIQCRGLQSFCILPFSK